MEDDHGYYTDSESSLIYCKNRYYSPSLGRWLSRDPAGFINGANLYCYCSGDPINLADPSGLDDSGSGDEVESGTSFNQWVDNVLLNGATARLGDTAGRYEAGKASPWEMAKAAADFAGNFASATATIYGAGGLVKGGVNAIKSMLSRRGCFEAGTLVAMADGSTLPINKLKEGMLVVSRDATSGTTHNKRISKTFKHSVTEIYQVQLADSHGRMVETIRGTGIHPFFTKNGQVNMAHLRAGMEVISRRGPPLTVKSLTRESHPAGVWVYNLEVEGDHTYFVGRSNGGALVHNAGPECTAIAKSMMRKMGGQGKILRVEPANPFGRPGPRVSPTGGYEGFSEWAYHDVYHHPERGIFDPLMQGTAGNGAWVPYGEYMERWDPLWNSISHLE